MADGCADLGSAASTFAMRCHQQRCSLVSGTRRGPPSRDSAPSPTARTGARMPRRLHGQQVSRTQMPPRGTRPRGDHSSCRQPARPGSPTGTPCPARGGQQVDPVDPHYVVAVLQRALVEGRGLLLPLRGEPKPTVDADRPAPEPRNCSSAVESKLDRPCKYSNSSTSATFGDLPRPRRQDRRGEPHPLTGVLINPPVVHPRCPHRQRTGPGRDLPLGVIAVAHDQPTAASSS